MANRLISPVWVWILFILLIIVVVWPKNKEYSTNQRLWEINLPVVEPCVQTIDDVHGSTFEGGDCIFKGEIPGACSKFEGINGGGFNEGIKSVDGLTCKYAVTDENSQLSDGVCPVMPPGIDNPMVCGASCYTSSDSGVLITEPPDGLKTKKKKEKYCEYTCDCSYQMGYNLKDINTACSIPLGPSNNSGQTNCLSNNGEAFCGCDCEQLAANLGMKSAGYCGCAGPNSTGKCLLNPPGTGSCTKDEELFHGWPWHVCEIPTSGLTEKSILAPTGGISYTYTMNGSCAYDPDGGPDPTPMNPWAYLDVGWANNAVVAQCGANAEGFWVADTDVLVTENNTTCCEQDGTCCDRSELKPPDLIKGSRFGSPTYGNPGPNTRWTCYANPPPDSTPTYYIRSPAAISEEPKSGGGFTGYCKWCYDQVTNPPQNCGDGDNQTPCPSWPCN